MRQLRSYIAPGAPATRTPCDGAEPPVRVEFGFTPRWYRQALAIDFGERWHLDPLYRAGTVTAMRAEITRRFPGLAIGGGDFSIPPANLDGVHGAMIMAMIFDIPVEYYGGNWPAALHAYRTPEAIAHLEPPALENTPVIVQLMEQMDIIEREFGRIEGYLNWQGVLNTAYRIRGPELFADLLAEPGLAEHLFGVITETMIAGMRLVYGRQRETGVSIQHATVSNCLVNMVSPEIYRETVMPRDARIAAAFDAFGIHNCAWNVDPYIADYASIQPLGYVDMGIHSDLARARALCPHARRAVMYTPTDLLNNTPEQLRADIIRIATELAPCDIVMADIDCETPDERVRLFAGLAGEACSRIA